MKKTLLLLSILFLSSCSSKDELYIITDGFVNSLQTEYESYGIFGCEEHTKYTSDSLYKIMPTGRLINVRIEKSVNKSEYEDLANDLKEHYEGKTSVNNVYICNGGTIMIDCRN